jgi:hypothetical protein
VAVSWRRDFPRTFTVGFLQYSTIETGPLNHKINNN